MLVAVYIDNHQSKFQLLKYILYIMLRYCVHAHTIYCVPLSTYHCNRYCTVHVLGKEVGGREERGKEKLHTCICVIYSKRLKTSFPNLLDQRTRSPRILTSKSIVGDVVPDGKGIVVVP